MVYHNLFKHCIPAKLMNTVAAGKNDTQTSSALDTQGFIGAALLVSMGTIVSGGTGVIKLQHSTDDGSTDAYADVAGSGYSYAVADTLKQVVIDVYRPAKRYIKVLVVRNNDQNASIDTVAALLYHGQTQPGTAGTTVSAIKILTNAASGTA